MKGENVLYLKAPFEVHFRRITWQSTEKMCPATEKIISRL